MNIKWGVTLAATLIILGSLYLWQQNRYEAMADVVATNYKSRLANIGESMDQLHEDIESSLLFNSSEQASEDLISIWRTTDKIRYEMSTLPFEEDSTTHWLNYLARIGDSANLAERGDIDFDEWKKTMRGSEQNLELVTSEWSRTNGSLQKKEDLLTRFYRNELNENSIQQVKELNKLVQTYTESDFPVTSSESDQQKKKELAALKGKKMSERQIVEQWKKDFPELKDMTIRVSKSKSNAPYPFYHIEFVGGDKKGFADYSEVGGQLLSSLIEQPYSNTSQEPSKLQQAALERVQHLGYKDTVVTASRENHMAWHYTFSRKMPNQAIVYSDSIQVKVAKDTGEILGVQPMEYIQEEKLPASEPREIDPKEFLASDVTLNSSQLAYIENHMAQQVLVYEWSVSSEDGKQYKLFIDAQTHEILKKEKLNG